MLCLIFVYQQFTLWKFPGGLADLGENIGRFALPLLEYFEFSKVTRKIVFMASVQHS